MHCTCGIDAVFESTIAGCWCLFSLGEDVGQLLAAFEYVAVDVGHCCGEGHLGKFEAVSEGVGSDLGHTFGDDDVLQGMAAREYIGSEIWLGVALLLQSGRQHDVLKRHASLESIVTDAGDVVGDSQSALEVVARTEGSTLDGCSCSGEYERLQLAVVKHILADDIGGSSELEIGGRVFVVAVSTCHNVGTREVEADELARCLNIHLVTSSHLAEAENVGTVDVASNLDFGQIELVCAYESRQGTGGLDVDGLDTSLGSGGATLFLDFLEETPVGIGLIT